MYGNFQCAFCAEVRERVVSHVRTGYVKSCHCQNSARTTRHGQAVPGAESPAYSAWCAMKKRCLNPRHRNFRDYGGRGISVCERWLVFENFFADMGDRPAHTSLDRIDNNAGYCPENCRWTSIKEQNNNRRSNTILRFRGKALTISQWSRETGIKDCTISERLRRGWTVKMTLTTAVRKYGGHESDPPAAT
jgi:hypothetical protein